MSTANNSQSSSNDLSTIEIDGIEIFGTPDQCQEPVTGIPNHCLAPVPPIPTGADGVPVEDDAMALSLSVNALKKRLRKGSLNGYKVSGKHGDKWFVDRNELPVCQEPVTGIPNQCLAPVPPIPTGADGVPVSTDKHLEIICDLQSKIEILTYRNGYL